MFCDCRCCDGFQLCQCGHLIIDVEKLQAASSSLARHHVSVTCVELCVFFLIAECVSFCSCAEMVLNSNMIALLLKSSVRNSQPPKFMHGVCAGSVL